MSDKETDGGLASDEGVEVATTDDAPVDAPEADPAAGAETIAPEADPPEVAD